MQCRRKKVVLQMEIPKEKKEEKKKERALAPEIRQISIMLDTYDDIFSDFDPRGYAERELSTDFTNEMNKRYRTSRTGRIEVRFTLPEKERRKEDEEKIVKRIKQYFAWRVKESSREISNARKKAAGFIIAGITITLLYGVLSEYYDVSSPNYFFEILLVAGWFLMWTGLEKFFLGAQHQKKDVEESEKFRKAEYMFFSEESIAESPAAK